MPSKTTVLLAVVAALALAGAAPKPTVKTLMSTVVDPASNLVFAVQGDVDPENGPDAAKTPAARWAEGGAAAARLAAAAQSLEQPGLAKDEKLWKAEAEKMARAAERAGSAALAHDGAQFSAAANDLSDTCSGCHARYKPQT